MAYLILDIETIPLPPIDNEVEEAIAKKIQARIEKTGDAPENAESLIRSTSPFFGQVLCVGMRWLQDDGSTRDKVVCEENEEATLRTFFEVINHSSTQGAKFVHYNGMGFDIPFLTTRAAHYNIEITNRKFTNLRRFTFDHHVDVMLYLCNWNNYNSVSMDIACRSFGIPSPKEGDVKGDTVAKAFEEGNIEAVNEYVMRDVEATHQLFEKLKQYII